MSKYLTFREALIDSYLNLSEEEKKRISKKYRRNIKIPVPKGFISIEEYEKWLNQNGLK